MERPQSYRGACARYLLLYLCVSQPLVGVLATLSKSDRGGAKAAGGKKPPSPGVGGGAKKAAGGTDGVKQAPAAAGAGKTAKAPAGGNGKPSSAHAESAGANSVTWSEIARNHERLDRGGDKQFPNTALGYVTPWHNRGYTLAESEAGRFELVAPVWLQVVPSSAGAGAAPLPGATCTVTGGHDVDHGWMGRLRQQNPIVKIVPRLLFEKWPAVDFIRFFADQAEQDRCADVVLDYLQRNEFAGAVIELWMLVMSMSQGHVAKDLQDFVINWSEHFHQRRMLVVLPVPPPLMPAAGSANAAAGVDAPASGYMETGLFTAGHLATLAPHVDYVHVMLYDFQDRGKWGPVAPLDWVARSMEYLAQAAGPHHRSKLLLGINFYGYQYQRGRAAQASVQPPHNLPQAIVGNVYVDMLNKWRPALVWNKNAHEHYFTTADATVYYPSLQSLALRLDLAKKLGVGVAIWDLGQGLDYFYNLL